MHLFIRVKLSYFLFAPAIESFDKVCSRMAVYEHNENENNIHIHIYMEDVTCSTDTLKNYIRKVTRPGKGNEFWSFKEATDNGTIRYMSKGIHDPKYLKGYTTEEIDAHKRLYVPMAGKKQTKIMYIVKESQKESKLRQGDMINEIIKRISDEDDYTEERILKEIRQVVIVEQKCIIGRYKIRDYFDTIRARLLNPQSWIQEMKIICRINT